MTTTSSEMKTSDSTLTSSTPKTVTNEPKLQFTPFKEGESFKNWAVSFVRVLQATGKPYYPVLLNRRVGRVDLPSDKVTLSQLRLNLFHFLCECTKGHSVTRQITSPYENRVLSLGEEEDNPATEVSEIWEKFVKYFDGNANIDLHSALDRYDEFTMKPNETLQAMIARFDDICIKLVTLHNPKREFDKRRKFVKALPTEGKWVNLVYELRRYEQEQVKSARETGLITQLRYWSVSRCRNATL